MPHPERHLVKRGQILIAGAGTLGDTELYGRAIIADSRLEGRYVGPDAMTLTLREPDSDQSLFAYVFLMTRVGLRAIRATSFGTKILRLRKDLLRTLPIPSVDRSLRARVAALIRRSIEGRETYVQELCKARREVEDLPEMVEAHAMCDDRQRRAVLWDGSLSSMRAWNYASTGGASQYLLKAWSLRIGDVVPAGAIFRGNRYNRVECEAPHGVEMLSQRDAFLTRPVPRRIVRPAAPEHDLFVRPSTIVLAGAGTLGEGELFGRAMYVSDLFSGKACTELLLRLEPRHDTEVLYAYLTTKVGLRLLRSTIFGTKLGYLHPGLVRSLPMPTLSERQRARVTLLVKGAFAAKDASLVAESEAVRIIEDEVLPAWLA